MLGLGWFIVVVLLIFVITTGCVIIVPVCQELSKHLLDVVQGFLLGFESMLLCFHAMKESSSLLLSAMLADTNLTYTELMVVEEE